MFYIKRICHDYFNKKSKVRFYGVVKKNDWNIFYNAIIILYQIVKKIPLFNNLIIYLKNNIFMRGNQNKKYGSAMDKLHQMRNKEFNWNLVFSNPTIIKYIKYNIDIIKNKTIVNDKAKAMELSRILNLEIFLDSSKSNFYD